MRGVLRPSVVFNTVSRDGAISKDVSVDIQNAGMLHDFAITPHYAVFLDHNLQFSLPVRLLSSGLI